MMKCCKQFLVKPKPKQEELPIQKEERFDDELGYLGPMRIVLFQSQEGYACNVFFGCWILLCHLLIGATVFLTVKPLLSKAFHSSEKITTIDIHILLCSIGYQLLISEAILCMNFYNGWSPPLREYHKKRAHWMLQFLGSTLALSGILTIVLNGKQEFADKHAIIGIITGSFTLASVINGLCALYACEIRMCASFWKVFHSCFGIPAFVLSTIAYVTGVLKSPEMFQYLNDISSSNKTSLIILSDIKKPAANSVSYILIVFSMIYTTSIVVMPLLRLLHFWSSEVL